MANFLIVGPFLLRLYVLYVIDTIEFGESYLVYRTCTIKGHSQNPKTIGLAFRSSLKNHLKIVL